MKFPLLCLWKSKSTLEKTKKQCITVSVFSWWKPCGGPRLIKTSNIQLFAIIVHCCKLLTNYITIFIVDVPRSSRSVLEPSYILTRSTWECLLFIFFDCNVFCKDLLSLFLEKIWWPVLFSCKLITLNTNWSINSSRETAVDILDVLESPHGNVFSEVLSRVVAYQHEVN